MREVYLAGAKVRLNPAKAIGKGGEADIYDIGNGKALKVFKSPDHPDLTGQPVEQQAARDRIAIHQEKLKQFPANLPNRVIVPEILAYDRSGKLIVGYAMHLLPNAEVFMRYSDRTFREAGIPNEAVIEILTDLHRTVQGVHRANVVIGDFNDLNVLVHGRAAYLIDADSFQFGKFPCRVFTVRFVDPLLCDPKATSLALTAPHNTGSDWYAFAVMAMQSLLFVDPYGGIYRPKDSAKRLPHGARPLHRITVFNPEVKYPKPATPYGVLPDEWLDYFQRVFEKDERGEFPIALLNNIRWTKCGNCGTEHARGKCPHCAFAAPTAVKEVTVVRGKVMATRLFRTTGLVVATAYENGKLLWLYHEGNAFKREDGTVAASGGLDPAMRFRLSGRRTMIAKSNRLITFEPNQPADSKLVDTFGTLPVFDANELSRFWSYNGQLWRDGQFGPEYIGDVLEGQTLFWVGPAFGFGFYRAGNLSVAFVFDSAKPGLNDSVKLPPIRGQLVDATCCFTKDRCWFFVTRREKGRTINQCSVIRPNGMVEATEESESGDGTWLGTIRGKCAAGNFLLSATDEGIVRIEIQGNRLIKTREFPDTEPFVSAGTKLYPGPQGLYAVGRREIHLLKIT